MSEVPPGDSIGMLIIASYRRIICLDSGEAL